MAITHLAGAVIAGIHRADSTTVWTDQLAASSTIRESRLIGSDIFPARNLLEQVVRPGPMLDWQRLVFVNLPGTKVSATGSCTDSADALATSAPKVLTEPLTGVVWMRPGLTISGFGIDLDCACSFPELLDLRA